VNEQQPVLPGQERHPAGLKIPGAASSAADLPGLDEAFIPNAYAGQQLLTMRQAIDCINFLSAALLADQRIRNAEEGGG
jgi:hypothetical protein